MRPYCSCVIFVCLITMCSSCASRADEGQDLQRAFAKKVLPLLREHCLDCHGPQDPEAKFDISRFTSAANVADHYSTWQHVVERVSAGDMPPADSRQPNAPARKDLLEWSGSFRRHEAKRNAGDPGAVLPHRLNVAEYNNTIRDLTGVDIQPARQFPVDRTNQAGFDNSGESLEMTPGLLMKYFEAARSVSEHLLLTPDGIAFAPHPVMVDTDRDKFCVRQIVDFYDRRNTNYADYFFTAWRLRQLKTDTLSEAAVSAIAREENVSPKYLNTIWGLLTGTDHNFGPIAKLRTMWREIPDDTQQTEKARRTSKAMNQFVVGLRGQLKHEFEYLSHRGINNGSQPFVLWRNRQFASKRQALNEDALIVEGAEKKKQGFDDAVKAIFEGLSKDAFAAYLRIPGDPQKRRQHIDAFETFCRIFPDTFFVRSRGRDYKGLQGQHFRNEGKVRLLSAGFHSQMGFFRDDAPLYELMLSDDEQKELDALWLQFDFVADISRRQHQGYLWYERSESGFIGGPKFDFARGEDEDITSEAKIKRLAREYLAKAKRTGAKEDVVQAIDEHFQRVNTNIRRIESVRKEARSTHIAALRKFARRAFRRPLTEAEKKSIKSFYDELRQQERLNHEDAVRDVLVWILTSPHFCYRSLPSDADEPIHALSQFALAGRLSYFLWSSMPDEPLLESARRGELHKAAVIRGHVRRMIGDDRIRGFAQQFAGNWLGFAGFENHKGVNRDRFPQFDDDLRRAMSREPVEFLIDVLRRDGSFTEVLEADHTFVNQTLAVHYGIEADNFEPGEWKRINTAGQYGRGGILPMSVFLTKSAHALRTSPVQRGYWVAKQLLGERIPPPPADVPDLPQDEKQSELSLVQLLAKHREHTNCAGCHNRFDSLGVALEAFDPIGQSRKNDMGGRPIETKIALPDGVIREGVAGLREYIRQHRRQDFVDNASRKLLSYALGRTLIVADDILLEKMREEAHESSGSIASLIEMIVTSHTFLNQRGRNFGKNLAAKGTP